MIKKIALRLGVFLALAYLLLITVVFFYQEKLLFYAEKIPDDYQFNYEIPFTEMNFKMEDSVNINGLLFKADSTKGLVFYLHGNAFNLSTWGRVAEPFIANNYDCFILDYRGYGKSGAI